MLSAEQISSWKEQGYCLAPNFFNKEETEALQAEVNKLKELGKLRNVRMDGDGKTESKERMNLQLCPASTHSDLIRALPFSNKVKEAVTALLGGPNLVQLDQIFLKPAQHGDGTSWHQDNAYFGALDNTMGTGMWIAIHEATVANGTMRIIPNSHTTTFEHKRDPNSNHHIRCFPNEDKALDCVLPAGGVLFFNYGIAHCTGANQTDTDRAGLAYHFHHEDTPLGKGQIRDNRERRTANGHPIPRLEGGDYGLTEYGQSQEGRFDELVKQPKVKEASL